MATETTEAVRQAGNLQNVVNRHRLLLEKRPRNEDGKENRLRVLTKKNDETEASHQVLFRI
jgi:hypothetical protein